MPPSKVSILLQAARPKTLPAAVAPVLCGSALAWRLTGECSALLLFATLAGTIAIQVATNYFNDAIDAGKGADTAARLGPQRATAAGLISPRGMMTAGLLAALVAMLCSIPLLSARGWPIVLIGAVSLYFSYGYTGGPWPLAYRGMGDLFVLLFFGLIAVTGTVFVHTGVWHAEALLLGVAVGSLSTVLIAINNLRDAAEDRQSGKRTLAVRFGETWAEREVLLLCTLAPAAALVAGAFLAPEMAAAWLIPLCIPLGFGAQLGLAVMTTPPGRVFNLYLAQGGMMLVAFTGLFCALCTAPEGSWLAGNLWIFLAGLVLFGLAWGAFATLGRRAAELR